MIRRKYRSRRRISGRRKTARKGYRRFYKRRIPRTVGPPSHVYVKLKYSDIRQVALSAAGMDQRFWRLNSVFDPDQSGIGGQPLYHDQYSALYSSYRVFGCKVNWKVSTSTTQASWYAPYVCMVPYISAPGYETIEAAMQAPNAVWRMVMPGQQIANLTKYYNIASIAGVPKRAVGIEDSFAAAITSNPMYVVGLQALVQNNDATAVLITTQEMTLTFYVKYFNRMLPSAS